MWRCDEKRKNQEFIYLLLLCFGVTCKRLDNWKFLIIMKSFMIVKQKKNSNIQIQTLYNIHKQMYRVCVEFTRCRLQSILYSLDQYIVDEGKKKQKYCSSGFCLYYVMVWPGSIVAKNVFARDSVILPNHIDKAQHYTIRSCLIYS